MSSVKRISIVFFSLAWIVLCCFPAVGLNIDEAPEVVTIGYLQELYEEVEFDHQAHMDMYDCSACHHHTLGTGTENENCKKCHSNSAGAEDVSCSDCHQHQIGPILSVKEATPGSNAYHIDTPTLKGAFHLQCLGCHQTESGPSDCQDCHVFTQAGRERFLLKN